MIVVEERFRPAHCRRASDKVARNHAGSIPHVRQMVRALHFSLAGLSLIGALTLLCCLPRPLFKLGHLPTGSTVSPLIRPLAFARLRQKTIPPANNGIASTTARTWAHALDRTILWTNDSCCSGGLGELSRELRDVMQQTDRQRFVRYLLVTGQACAFSLDMLNLALVQRPRKLEVMTDGGDLLALGRHDL